MPRRPRRNGPFLTDSALEALASWGFLAFILGLAGLILWS